MGTGTNQGQSPCLPGIVTWEPPMSKTRHPRTTREDDCEDPLGKLIEQYHVNLASVLAIAGAIGLVGLGAIAFALSRQPRSSTFLLAGRPPPFLAFSPCR